MTPFEKAGYTKDTKFRVIKDYYSLKIGDIVTLFGDDGNSRVLEFKTKDGRGSWCWLPNVRSDGKPEELEVYES